MTLRMVIGGLIGALVGYGIYRFIGCRTGACPLTGNPYVAIALYTLLGLLIARNP